LTELLECGPERLAFYAYRSARTMLHTNMWNVQWYCRHARQDVDRVEQWPAPLFRARLGVMQGILEKEWEVPGD
jgi:hypothetical protein